MSDFHFYQSCIFTRNLYFYQVRLLGTFYNTDDNSMQWQYNQVPDDRVLNIDQLQLSF